MLRLCVRLVSPVCVGSGVGRPGIVDRDVVFDREGLPYLPGRRLKGLLRDSYSQLRESGGAAFLNLPEPEEVFGSPGRKFSGPVRIQNGRLNDAEKIANWLKPLYEVRDRKPVRREDVINFYTDIRRQTSINRKRGSAAENTLRSTRVLRAGLEFYAPVQTDTERDKQCLTLAAAALESMGASRTRGIGQVRCSLEEDGANLRLWALGPVSGENDTRENMAKSKPDSVASEGFVEDSADRVLRFSLGLRDPAIFPKLAGDAFTINTHESIPGSTIQGALAMKYLENQPAPDADFEHLFLSGGVRFLAANPTIIPDDQSEPARFLPVPLAIRQLKDESGYLNFAVQPDEELQDQLSKRTSGWSEVAKLWNQEESLKPKVDVDLQYHHQRALDRRIGRAVSLEDQKEKDRYSMIEGSESGTMFTYESISPGQNFIGAVLGNERDLESIRALISDHTEVRLGRSRATQYGARAAWTWLDSAPLAMDARGGEVAGWADESTEARNPESAKIIVNLLSPLLSVNDKGHPVAEFPVSELAEALGFGPKELKPDRAMARTSWQGGYLSHQGLPRQQVLGLAPGSVFVLELPAPRSGDDLRRAERQSYGVRVEEGFGRIAILPFPDQPWYTGSILFPDPKKRKSPKPPIPLPDAARELAMGILRKRVEQHAIEIAFELSDEGHTTKLDAIHPHLLARLSRILEQNEMEYLGDLLAPPEPRAKRQQLRDAARKQLEGCRVYGQATKTLKDFLVETCRNWEARFASLAADVFESEAAYKQSFGQRNPLLDESGKKPADTAFGRRILKAYLLRYLSALAMRKRGAK